MTPNTHHDLWPEAADSRHSTAHARSQRSGERDLLTGLRDRKNGFSLLARREGAGRGETGTECVTRETLSVLWLALRCGEKTEQQRFRPGSESSLITIRK